MQQGKSYCVYIMASRSLTLYIGVSGHLWRRVLEHKTHDYPRGFTARYRVERLVHVEVFGEVTAAIAREKELKAWRREKKIALIRAINPTGSDLAEHWYTPAALSGKLEFGPRSHF
ncbi:MAG: GIY-YIG nuclease family protein [Candidatus Korobacteraceae bacterium]